MANVERRPHVLSASDPLAAATTSRDGRTAYSTVHFSASTQSLGAGHGVVVAVFQWGWGSSLLRRADHDQRLLLVPALVQRVIKVLA